MLAEIAAVFNGCFLSNFQKVSILQNAGLFESRIKAAISKKEDCFNSANSATDKSIKL